MSSGVHMSIEVDGGQHLHRRSTNFSNRKTRLRCCGMFGEKPWRHGFRSRQKISSYRQSCSQLKYDRSYYIRMPSGGGKYSTADSRQRGRQSKTISKEGKQQPKIYAIGRGRKASNGRRGLQLKYGNNGRCCRKLGMRWFT